MKTLKTLFTLVILLITLVAHAHPGHGVSDGFSVFHYLGSPLHVGIATGLALLVGVTVYFIKRKKKQIAK